VKLQKRCDDAPHSKALRAEQNKSAIYFAKLFGVRCVLASLLTPEDREEREKQAERNAQNDAGDDGKIERGMFALDPNVAGQSAQPFWREAAPHHQTNERGNCAHDYDELSKVTHRSKSCANQPNEQASE
jgi:hypothetical protein